MGYKGVGLDSSKNMINIAINIFLKTEDEQKWKFLVGDAEKTPLKIVSLILW